MYHNRKPNEEANENNFEYVSLDKLLSESDFVICTCAATKETEKIFNKNLFEKMKPTSVFINVSRGSVVNQEDLYYCLKNKVIAAAGLKIELYFSTFKKFFLNLR
jgi:lactate dehydrogenase-like 2-hydroxyacid dehydrogenase